MLINQKTVGACASVDPFLCIYFLILIDLASHLKHSGFGHVLCLLLMVPVSSEDAWAASFLRPGDLQARCANRRTSATGWEECGFSDVVTIFCCSVCLTRCLSLTGASSQYRSLRPNEAPDPLRVLTNDLPLHGLQHAAHSSHTGLFASPTVG